METIEVRKLRENLLIYLNKVQQGQSITITSHGNKVAMLVPVKKEMEDSRIANALGPPNLKSSVNQYVPCAARSHIAVQ